MTEREKLAEVAKRAGYDKDALLLIAKATVPSLKPGDRLTDEQMAQVRMGAETLEVISYPPDALLPIMDSFVRRYGETDWRFEFWKVMLRRASQAEQNALAATQSAT